VGSFWLTDPTTSRAKEARTDDMDENQSLNVRAAAPPESYWRTRATATVDESL